MSPVLAQVERRLSVIRNAVKLVLENHNYEQVYCNQRKNSGKSFSNRERAFFKLLIMTWIFFIVAYRPFYLWLSRDQAVLQHCSIEVICIMSLMKFTRNHNSTAIKS
ncbi:hypothetical protein XM38_013070 [Halomicronema hongdechloris C2206]|uniref:Uncharacterized protein n=1 Tax=Halomicronema hongdechloris C2206 TaxID=1641165 RepID=A0A1Z3HJ84_9CYAN|nr:hypothetical protein XM38_013070 [Halomicronema hongdechloris C2206]